MKQLSLFVLGGLMLVLTGCGPAESSKTEPKTPTAPVTRDTSEVFQSAKSIFYSLPSPMELSTLIKSAGGEFRKDLLHDPNKANTYQSTQKRALALGLYGADLSYSSVYNMTGDAVKFLAASKRLGETIGIQEAFSANLIERANINLGNRDSMFSIMTEMYWQTNSQLKEENRDQLALIVMAGGWAEGLYMGCNAISSDDPQPQIEQRMAEQMFASKQMEEMFNFYDDDPMVADVHALFQPTFDLFNSLTIVEVERTISEDEATGKHTIGGESQISFGPDDMEKLTLVANELRSKIVEP
jgi:hypothetical protein